MHLICFICCSTESCSSFTVPLLRITKLSGLAGFLLFFFFLSMTRIRDLCVCVQTLRTRFEGRANDLPAGGEKGTFSKLALRTYPYTQPIYRVLSVVLYSIPYRFSDVLSFRQQQPFFFFFTRFCRTYHHPRINVFIIACPRIRFDPIDFLSKVVQRFFFFFVIHLSVAPYFGFIAFSAKAILACTWLAAETALAGCSQRSET